jgi:hypothetical protein
MKPQLWIALGLSVAFLAEFISMKLGDNHRVDVVGGWSPWKRLTHIWPDPLDCVYGLPFGLIGHGLGGWGFLLVLLAAGAGYLYESRAEHNPYFEYEDVRDVIIGALVGWLL